MYCINDKPQGSVATCSTCSEISKYYFIKNLLPSLLQKMGMAEVGIGPSPDGVAPSRIVSVSASVNLSLHHEVQKFSSGTGSLGGPGKRAVKRLWCGGSAAEEV